MNAVKTGLGQGTLWPKEIGSAPEFSGAANAQAAKSDADRTPVRDAATRTQVELETAIEISSPSRSGRRSGRTTIWGEDHHCSNDPS